MKTETIITEDSITGPTQCYMPDVVEHQGTVARTMSRGPYPVWVGEAIWFAYMAGMVRLTDWVLYLPSSDGVTVTTDVAQPDGSTREMVRILWQDGSTGLLDCLAWD